MLLVFVRYSTFGYVVGITNYYKLFSSAKQSNSGGTPERVHERGCSQYISVLVRQPEGAADRKFLTLRGVLFQYGGAYARQNILFYKVVQKSVFLFYLYQKTTSS